MKRVYQHQESTQLPLPSNNGEGSNPLDVKAEEEDSVKEIDLEAKDMEVRANRDQETQVSQPIGVGMGQRLEFFAQQMTAQHKPTTTHQYSQHWTAWKVCFS